MRFQIEHNLSYKYSTPAVLDEQTIRLKPRLDTRQIINRFKLDFSPQPSFQTHYLDCENNACTTAWFHGSTETFRISAFCDVETFDCNPFDFVLAEPQMNTLPVAYSEPARKLLSAYIHIEQSKILEDFVKSILTQKRQYWG